MLCSVINLVLVTLERYLKVVYSTWSKVRLRSWMIYAAAATSWICGITYNMALCFSTTDVIDGVCYGYVIWESRVSLSRIWNVRIPTTAPPLDFKPRTAHRSVQLFLQHPRYIYG